MAYYNVISDLFNSLYPKYELHAVPPPHCTVSSSAPEVKHPIFLREIGVDKLAAMIQITPSVDNNQVNLVIDEELMGVLSYSQLYQIQCNMLWVMKDFVGSVFDDKLYHNILSALRQLLVRMMEVEIIPGDFGFGIMTPDDIQPSDFDLEDWE